MIDQLLAERHDITWWRTPPTRTTTDPHAQQHRQELLAALVGTSDYRSARPRKIIPPAPDPEPDDDEPDSEQWTPATWTTAELIDEVEHLEGTDSPHAIADRLGITVATLAKRLGRAGRHDLARPFYRAQRQERAA